MAVSAEGECNRCGDCCTAIALSSGVLARVGEFSETPDPRDDETWRSWWTNWSDVQRAEAIDWWLNAQTVAGHWRSNGDGSFRCDHFDNGSCRIYQDRPPVCSGYPWYGETPTDDRASRLSGRCSFRGAAPTLRLWEVAG